MIVVLLVATVHLSALIDHLATETVHSTGILEVVDLHLVEKNAIAASKEKYVRKHKLDMVQLLEIAATRIALKEAKVEPLSMVKIAVANLLLLLEKEVTTEVKQTAVNHLVLQATEVDLLHLLDQKRILLDTKINTKFSRKLTTNSIKKGAFSRTFFIVFNSWLLPCNIQFSCNTILGNGNC